MIATARALHSALSQVAFVNEESGPPPGRLHRREWHFQRQAGNPATEWEAYMLQTLEAINSLSAKGFTF
jgi:hypothetical protein